MKHFPSYARVIEAYKSMADKARYRPGAPGDGFGSVDLTEEQIQDAELLHKEASEYAARFLKEEDTAIFHIGVSDYASLRALVFTIEAAKNLCGGSFGQDVALKLLKLAAEEMKTVIGN